MRMAELVALAVATWASAGFALEVQVTVTESAGEIRSAEPVSGGIPLPAGQFKKDQAFALFDGEKEVPVQVLPLVVGEKGDLRWILIDFQTDLAAGGAKKFTLKDAKPTAAPANPLKVTETADAVTLDTGRIKLVISRTKPFGLFDSVSREGKPVVAGGVISYTDGFDGKRYQAGKPASVEVEYKGPMRATVAVKGGFVGDEKTRLGFIARITVWSGRSDVHVKYSLANSNPEHYTWRKIKDSTIALKLAGGVAGTTLGGSKPVAVSGTGWLHQGLVASMAGGAKAGSGDEVKWTSAGRKDQAEGYLVAKAGGSAAYACDLYFTADPARRLATTKDSLLLTGVAERYGGVKDARGRERGRPWAADFRWLLDSSHISSQYLLDFGPVEKPAERARAGRSRLHAMAPPGWYSQTEGLSVGRFGTQQDELTCYKKWGWKYDPRRVPKGPHRTYGRFVRGEDNHYETEEDIVESLLLMYLRTGRRPFFDTCEAWVNYNADLQSWRTDGWRYKDGGVWWTMGGPLGNRPTREGDPVTGARNNMPGGKAKVPISKEDRGDLYFLANSKACYCHNWGQGLAGWFCITGDRDVLEAAIDNVEQNIDTQVRAFRKAPGKTIRFSRDFTRACNLTHATRMVVPTDPFVVEVSDYLARIYLERPVKEARGLVVPPAKIDEETVEKLVGKGGMAEMDRLGVMLNPSNGMLADPRTFAMWHPVANPHTWMFPPLSNAMDCYYRLTGNEDARDWLIAYGQAVARVLWQDKHKQFSGRMLADFPVKGVVRDYASWNLPPDSKNGEGVAISGYLAQFHPDVCARGYWMSGEPFLKQRAHDYWHWGSHRGYQAKTMHNLGGVGSWVNYYGPHSESVTFTGRTFYIWAHPRTDTEPPAPVTDLAVTVNGQKATVSFTAPADTGGGPQSQKTAIGGPGKVALYQVKCAEKQIVDYETFLKAWPDNKDVKLTNWWMASNLKGEPAPGKPGEKVTFEVTGVPDETKYFAVRSFDDSDNRSPLSNVVEAAGR